VKHLKVFKVTYKSELSDVAYTLVHVFTCECKLSGETGSIPESFNFSLANIELWLASQKHVTLLTRVSTI